jgi:hypothetical protein
MRHAGSHTGHLSRDSSPDLLGGIPNTNGERRCSPGGIPRHPRLGVFTGVSPVPTRVVLEPRGGARFFLHYSDVPSAMVPDCPQASALLITPPDETHQVQLAASLAPCSGGTIDVSPVVAPDARLGG